MATVTRTDSTKEAVIRMIERMPEDCTLQDIQYHLSVRQKVEEAIRDIDEGRIYTQEDVERMTAEWLKSSGTYESLL